jgi:hypothetical protein
VKFICLCYEEEKIVNAMAGGDWAAVVKETYEYNDELRKKGHFVDAQSLHPVNDASTVRVRDGKVSITDGPFAETKEQLGGFFLIDAKDLDEALRIASRLSGARLGCIEVRPVRELSSTINT